MVYLFPFVLGPFTMLGILIVGLLIMGFGPSWLSALAFAALMYFLIAGGPLVAASLGAGFFAVIAWIAILALFCFDIGRLQHFRRDWSLGFHMVVLVTLMMVVCIHAFDMNVFSALFTTLVGAGIYAVIGVFLARFWKWRKFNREHNEKMFAQQGSWLRDHISEAAKRLPAGNESNGRSRRQETPTYKGIDITFSEAEIAELKMLERTPEKDLGRMRMPDALLPRWNKYRRSMKIASPKIRDHKAQFLSWVMGWPGFVAYEALHDIVEGLGRMLRRLFNACYQWLAAGMRKSQERLLGDRSDLLDLPEEADPAE